MATANFSQASALTFAVLAFSGYFILLPVFRGWQ